MANYHMIEDGKLSNIPSKTFVVDDDVDIEDIPMNFRMIPMTVVYVVNTGKLFMVNSAGTWVEQ